MTVSDLFTIIGILLAIFAFVSEKNREYILLKFSKTNVLILVLLFLYIHFLVSFDWWEETFKFLSIFVLNGFPSPSTWAYLISVSLLFWAGYKIFWGQFPISNRENLLKYYNKLILRNDYDFLSQLIENYHISQIVEFLIAKRNIKIKEESGIWHIDHKNYNNEFSKVINTPNLIYGGNVFTQVILNDAFIDNIANKNPYLFSTIIKELKSQSVKHEEFVNRYLKVLTYNKNSNFFREIRNNQNLGEFDAYAIEEERPILYALFNDVQVSSVNQAWRGIGEQAILEMQEEAKRDYSQLRESDREQQNDTLWSFRITIAIWYFDIMVRQAIKQNINDHMWLFYYTHFTETILTNMPDLPLPDSDQNRHSRNFDLLTDILTKMMDWKSVIINSKHNHLIKSVYDCLGQCLYKIAISDQLRKEDKVYLFNWTWEDLIKTYGEDDDQIKIVEEISEVGFSMFKKPCMLFSTTPGYRDNERAAYINVINTMWTKRDVPIFMGVYEELTDRFKKEIVDDLNK